MLIDSLKHRFMEDPLCTVTPSIFQTCSNDSISKNGTCFEDSCCTSVLTATSWYYRLAQFSHIFFSALGIFVILIYLKSYSKTLILSFNIRVFVNFVIFLIIIHSIDMIVIHVYHLFQSFRIPLTNPCFVRVRVSFCAPFRNFYSFSLLALAVTQYSIYIDRLICIFWSSYSKYHRWVLVILVGHIIFITTYAIIWIFREEDSDSFLLSCLNIPLASMEDLVSVTAFLFPVNILCFFLSILIFRIFQKRQKDSRFNMKAHFKDVIDVQSSEFLYHLTGTQAIFIVVYPVLSITMRVFYYDTPRPLHLTFATLSYIFSIYSFVVPLQLIIYAYKSHKIKKDRIFSHVKMKSVGTEGADNYFNSLRNQWG
ncbi:unnamed protein product [Caenorhabditis angaria]|uniref:Uncharacterized protein n=1 Tax=Caenorhabditis angaria TaxID=860376 RepID=A0A9P1J127_9PELO|nr:unnamed protein product [Caenorhabditis angaria]